METSTGSSWPGSTLVQDDLPLSLASHWTSGILPFLMMPSSKARQHGVPDLPAPPQHFSVFGAAVQCGDHLAGVEQSCRVECVLEAEHLRALLPAELHAHAVELFHAHAMLAGYRAAMATLVS